MITRCNFTSQETEMLLSAVGEYLELMSEAENTVDYTEYMLDNGLGSALKKLYKDRNGKFPYIKYVSHRDNYNYPTFEEWKKNRKEEDEDDYDE